MTFKRLPCFVRALVITSIYVQGVNSLSSGNNCQTSKSLNFFPCPPAWPQRLIYNQNEGPVDLSCFVMPENSSISWFKDGRQITTDYHIHISTAGNQLEIKSPVLNDTGNYTCVAENNGSHISYSGYIRVREGSTPTHPRIVNTDPMNLQKTVRLGTSTNISCTFDFGSSSSSPFSIQPVMQWRRNGTEIPDNDKYTYHHNSKDQQKILILETHNITKGDLGDYQCYARNKWGEISENITLKEIGATHSNSKIPMWVIIAVSGGGVVVAMVFLVTIVIVVIKRKRKDDIEWEDPDLDHYEVPKHQIQYDVFISYSSEDETWVKNTLLKNLQMHGYNVNVDFKDFVPGMAIAENIMDSIYKSRKTVVVMSKNFLKSMWGQFELQQAHNRAISQRKDVLVLVKYGKCKVPAKLMGKTFLDFTDKAIKPHFWQRFFDSIGKPGLDLAAVDVKDQGHLKEKKDAYIKNEEENKNINDCHGEQFEGYDHLIINLKNEKNKIEANQNEVNIRPKTGDHTKRLVSTESCDSQDSCIGRRVSLEEKKPLLC